MTRELHITKSWSRNLEIDATDVGISGGAPRQWQSARERRGRRPVSPGGTEKGQRKQSASTQSSMPASKFEKEALGGRDAGRLLVQITFFTQLALCGSLFHLVKPFHPPSGREREPTMIMRAREHEKSEETAQGQIARHRQRSWTYVLSQLQRCT